MTLNANICYLTDVLGNTYLGLKLSEHTIQDILSAWVNNYNTVLGVDLETMSVNREKRDGVYYHSTLVSVPEFTSERRKQVVTYLGTNCTINVLGIGKATDEQKGNEADFIVIESEALDNVREELGLAKKDLHITIGFSKKDVFTKRKDISSIYHRL